jgi:uncharacterized coiled-coil protein SlyX
MKKYILPIIILLLLCWIVFDKVKDFGLSAEFVTKQDSLVHAVDSMQLEIAKDDAEIDSLDIVAVELQYKLDHQKAKVKTIVEYIEIEKNSIDAYSDPELVSSFNNRYPKDTISNPLLVAQPVLVSAAKDLVELDGAKQIIVLKDSSIATLETKVAVKDSVITKYISKEDKFRLILTNKDKEIAGWEGQYQKLELQYNKLKVKSKFQRIGSYIIIGGLGYLMLAK